MKTHTRRRGALDEFGNPETARREVKASEFPSLDALPKRAASQKNPPPQSPTASRPPRAKTSRCVKARAPAKRQAARKSPPRSPAKKSPANKVPAPAAAVLEPPPPVRHPTPPPLTPACPPATAVVRRFISQWADRVGVGFTLGAGATERCGLLFIDGSCATIAQDGTVVYTNTQREHFTLRNPTGSVRVPQPFAVKLRALLAMRQLFERPAEDVPVRPARPDQTTLESDVIGGDGLFLLQAIPVAGGQWGFKVAQRATTALASA